MGPHTLEAFAASGRQDREILAAAMHVEDIEIAPVIKKLVRDHRSPFNLELLCPADNVVIESQKSATLVSNMGDRVKIAWLSPYGSADYGIEVFKKSYEMPRLIGLDLSDDADIAIYHRLWIEAHEIDLLFSLMAQPRLIREGRPPSTRKQRRKAQCILGSSVPAIWKRLSWTVGDEVAAKGGEAIGNWKMPLHFCRGGWMHLADGKVGHEICPCCGRQRSWRTHAWKGHPDYGVVLHNYNPKIDPDGKSVAAISALKRAASQAASNAAIAAWKQGA